MTGEPQAIWRDGDPDDLAGMEIFNSQAGRTSCPPPELVHALGAGTLPPDLEARVAAHVAHCGMCRTLGAALDDPSVGDLTADEQQRVLQRVRAGVDLITRDSRRRAWRWTAAAAAVAVAAVGFIFVWQARHSASGTAVELDVFKVRKPEPPPLDSTRQPNESTPQARERRDLEQALAPYRADNYTQAARSLAAFTARYPLSAAGHFYLGVSNLLLNREPAAVASLETAERLAGAGDAALARQATWYLAVAYLSNGQLDLGRGRLKGLCDGRTELARSACNGLQAISTYRLSGVVTSAAGEPLEGATVGEYLGRMEAGLVLASRGAFSGTTDTAGRYSVSGALLRSAGMTFVRASKPGYFSASAFVSISTDMRADFKLTPWRLVSLDEVVKGTLQPTDTCGGAPEPCRQFAVSMPRSGTLEVSVVTAVRDRMDVWIETPTGVVYSPLPESPLRVAANVFAGAVCQITVVNAANEPREPRQFELTMRLR